MSHPFHREIDQRVPGVELIDQIPVLSRSRMRYDTLSSSRAHRRFGIGGRARIVPIGNTVSSVNFS